MEGQQTTSDHDNSIPVLEEEASSYPAKKKRSRGKRRHSKAAKAKDAAYAESVAREFGLKPDPTKRPGLSETSELVLAAAIQLSLLCLDEDYEPEDYIGIVRQLDILKRLS